MTPSPLRSSRSSKRPVGIRTQSGVVLIIALIMLVVIALTSAAVMRSSLSADMVSQNARRQAQAMQAAQTALTYCEGLARSNVNRPVYVKAAAALELWATFANWSTPQAPSVTTPPVQNTAGQVSVPTGVLTSTVATNDPPLYAPQCMAQFRAMGTTTTQVVVVTARGFSNDYVATSGRTQAGAVVWLQSILSF